MAMACGDLLSSSFFGSTISANGDAGAAQCLCCRSARSAGRARKILPITVSSALKPKPISRSSSSLCRRTSSLSHNEAAEVEYRFVQNADGEMRAICEEGRLKEAVEYIELVHKGGLQMSPKSYGFLLQECAKMKALDEGKRVHTLLITSGVHMDVTIRNHLLSLYVKCGCLKEAKLMFEAMGSARDVVSWTLMLNACAQYGQFNHAMRLYYMMRKRRVLPNKITYVCLLKAFSSLPDGLATCKLLHEHIMKRSFEGDPYVGGALVDMYFKFGQVKSARQAFYAISKKTAYLWNRLIAGLVLNGKNREALKVYRHMRWRHHIEPSEATWAPILKACGDLEQLEEGRFCHFCLCRDGVELDGHVGQELACMYMACGSLVEARQVFDWLQSRPVSLWKHLIEAYTEHEQHEEAAKLALQMQEHEEPLLETSQIDSDEEHEKADELSLPIQERAELLLEYIQINSM